MKGRVTALIVLLAVGMTAYCQGRASWLETEHDFGDIKEENGKVSCQLRMVNAGDSALFVTRVQTTCGCTAADYPRYAINPGDTAAVTLTYNPYNRPGNFEKDAFVYTTGTVSRTRLTLTGNVAATPVTVNTRYPIVCGGLRLENASIPLGKLYRGSTRAAYISCYNASADTIIATTEGNKAHIAASMAPDTIPPGTNANFNIQYDTGLVPLWGFNADTLTIISEPLRRHDGSVSGLTHINVMSQVVDRNDNLTPEQLADAPQVRIEGGKLVDFDRLTATVTKTFSIKNTGKEPLILRRLWSPEGAVTATCSQTEIRHGETAAISVTVDMSLVDGPMLNAILYIITNDPYNQTTEVRLVGTVAK